MWSYKACFFSLVVSSLGFDMGDSVDTSLGCGFSDFWFVFFFSERCWLLFYKYVRGYKHLWALRNPIEEDFGLNFFLLELNKVKDNTSFRGPIQGLL